MTNQMPQTPRKQLNFELHSNKKNIATLATGKQFNIAGQNGSAIFHTKQGTNFDNLTVVNPDDKITYFVNSFEVQAPNQVLVFFSTVANQTPAKKLEMTPDDFQKAINEAVANAIAKQEGK
jgi:hypothetical protein